MNDSVIEWTPSFFFPRNGIGIFCCATSPHHTKKKLVWCGVWHYKKFHNFGNMKVFILLRNCNGCCVFPLNIVIVFVNLSNLPSIFSGHIPYNGQERVTFCDDIIRHWILDLPTICESSAIVKQKLLYSFGNFLFFVKIKNTAYCTDNKNW